MAKDTQADDRVAALENELRIMREQHAAELAAIRDDLRAARTADQAGAFERVFESMAQRIAEIDPAEQQRKMKDKCEALGESHDERVRETLRGLLVGEKCFALAIMEPVRDSAGPDGREWFQPWPGTGIVLFASSESAAEQKYRAYYGIRSIEDRRWLFCGAVPEAKQEGLRTFLGRLIDSGNNGEFQSTANKLAMKAANDSLPKPVQERESELEAMISAD